jgi:RNA polymerase sigma-70 factor, ECF subfamily
MTGGHMTFSDEELMVMFAAGTLEAFDMLYDRYRHRLYRFARSCLVSVSSAEDAVQDVFMRVIRSATQYRPGHSFKSWVFQIAANCIRDINRIERKMLYNDTTGFKMDDSSFNVRRIIAANELDQYLTVLEPNERILLILKEIEGLKTDALAEISGTSPGNIRVRLHRIRQKLAAGRSAVDKEDDI